MLRTVSKHTILRYFFVASPCSSFSCIFELSHFCRTFLRNYKRDLFSSAMINKISVPIISEEWDCMVWLPWKELSRVATLPYFRMLRPSKFRRSEFGGVWWERRALLFDMKPSLISPLPIKSCTIFEHFNLDTVISILCGSHLHSSLWPADSSAP